MTSTLVHGLLAMALGGSLLAAAALKLGDRTGTAVAAATFGLTGVPGRSVRPALIVLEPALAAGLLVSRTAVAAWAVAGVLAVFAVAQALAIAAGRAGAPCGCLGGRGRVSWSAVARAALLATTAVVLALGFGGSAPPLWSAAGALLVAVAICVRARRPDGALEVAGEGPALGTRPALGDGVELAFFTSAGCRLCRSLRPYAERLGGTVFDEADDAAAWTAAEVPGAPFAVALAADGRVLAKGTVNTRRQLASVLQTARARDAGRPERSSRRGFLATASAAVAVLTAGRTVASLIAPGDADAFHFCGHTYTTDSCPHPTGLPRIDRHGRPLRARDGRPVDDLGRLVDADGAPIDEAGAALLDPDGRPQPPARRRRVCAAAGKRYRIFTHPDGSWYRCCDGHVRKLIDCCTTSSHRINGDGALTGYCYAGRRVFCVTYFQTKVPC